jgi:ferric-dicitrate binding protein FerR (iron transport regulator)
MTKHENDRFPPELEQEHDADELRAVWSALDGVERDEGPSVEATDAAWTSLSERLGFEKASEGPSIGDHDAAAAPEGDSRPAMVAPSGSWLRAVAVLVLLSAAVWQAVPISHATSEGERMAVTLPDGSDVVLNASSSLRHRRGFSWVPGVPQGRRVVRLEGEAFFEVTEHARPFQVSTGGARVTVLGTRFNVYARAATALESGVRVDVEEGRVLVAVQGSPAVAEVGAGEGVRVMPGARALTPEPVSPTRIAAWRSGGLTVNDEPLSVVVAELGLRFGIEVTLADSVDGSVRVSAYYPLLTGIESVLGDLATQQNLRSRRTADGWELF